MRELNIMLQSLSAAVQTRSLPLARETGPAGLEGPAQLMVCNMLEWIDHYPQRIYGS